MLTLESLNDVQKAILRIMSAFRVVGVSVIFSHLMSSQRVVTREAVIYALGQLDGAGLIEAGNSSLELTTKTWRVVAPVNIGSSDQTLLAI